MKYELILIFSSTRVLILTDVVSVIRIQSISGHSILSHCQVWGVQVYFA